MNLNTMKKKILVVLPLLSIMLLVPIFFVSARDGDGGGLINLNAPANIPTKLTEIVNEVIPLLIGVALIFFIYALLKFILVAGEKKDDARSQMIYGIIILAVIVGVWALVNALLGTFGLSPSASPNGSPPQIPTTSGGN
jgi:hypothetical protein